MQGGRDVVRYRDTQTPRWPREDQRLPGLHRGELAAIAARPRLEARAMVLNPRFATIVLPASAARVEAVAEMDRTIPDDDDLLLAGLL